MHRRLESQLMNREQCKAFADVPKDNAIDFFIECIDEYFWSDDFEDCLSLAAGPAEYDIAFVKEFNKKLDSIDTSDDMLEIALQNITKAGVSDLISLKKLHIPFVIDKKYDLIFCVNSLHHFHNPLDLWNTIKAHSKKGTQVLVLDLHRPDTEDVALYMSENYSPSSSDIFKTDFYNSMLASFTADEIVEQLKEVELDLTVRVENTQYEGGRLLVIWGEL